MLKRKIISILQTWKDEEKKDALLLRGARQVGKTTIVREFGRLCYNNVVEINFEQSPLARQAFDGNLDAYTIISKLTIMGYGPFVPHKTLVFFDEIQSCPNARTAIKFLVENAQFDYIESGSLLGLNYKEVSSYPVGFEYSVDMYPLDFEEFLWAKGIDEKIVELLRDAFESCTPVDSFIHEQMMKYYQEYLVVGGMPQVVNTYISNSDFAETLRQQRKIIQNYRDDISKYAGLQKTKAKIFFDAIPSELSKERKRFILKNIDDEARNIKYQEAAEWLIDAGVAYFSYNLHGLSLPIIQHENRSYYKVFLLDTGLLCAMWNEKELQWKVMQGEIDINKGALTENFVAAEIVKHGANLHYYDRKSRQELDFVMATSSNIVIYEVKSGKDYKRHASLYTALQENPQIKRATVICKYNLELVGDVLYLPLYMTMFL